MKNDPRLNQTSSKVRCQELMKITSQEWTTLDSKKKKIYEDKSALDLQRHRNQTNQNQMLGYFILENGMKSTEMPLDTKWQIAPKAISRANIYDASILR